MPRYKTGLPYELAESPFTKSMRERLDDFTTKYEKGVVAIKEQGKECLYFDPFTRAKATFSQVIAYLVSEYIRLKDRVMGYCQDYTNEKDENEKYKIKFVHNDASLTLSKVGDALLHAIEYGRGLKLMDEEIETELQELRNKVKILESNLIKEREENHKLRAELEGLRQTFHLETSVEEDESREDQP